MEGKALPAPNQGIKRANFLFLLYFVVTIGGGALRKWIFTDGAVGNFILLLLMVMPFTFLYFLKAGIISPFKRFNILYLLTAVLAYHIINPYQHTIFHGLLGVLVYAPFWLGSFYLIANRHAFRLEALRWVFLGVAMVEIFLCFVQYSLPPDHVLNKYAVERVSGIAMVGDAVRVTGTFSFLSGLTAYTVFHAFLCWAILRWRFPPWVFFSFLLAGLILCFMAGSRSGTLIYIGLAFGILVHEFPPRLLGRLAFQYILPSVLIFFVVIRLGNGPVFDNANRAIDNFVNRVSTLSERGEQNKRVFMGLEKFDDFSYFPDPILGVGAGATYQGANILFGKSDAVTRFGYYESEFVQSFLEGGVVMLILRIALILTLLRQLPFTWPIKWFLFICMIYGLPIIFNVYNAAFLMMGIALVDNTMYWQRVEYLRAKQEAAHTAAAPQHLPT
jgi:hypothetical protein